MNSIKTKLMKEDGVHSVEIELEEGLVKVSHSESVGQELIEQALSKMGYPAIGKNTLGAQAKSYVSCMVGRMNN